MGHSFSVFFIKREAKRKLFNLVYTNPVLAVCQMGFEAKAEGRAARRPRRLWR
jgi:hypothetical protein